MAQSRRTNIQEPGLVPIGLDVRKGRGNEAALATPGGRHNRFRNCKVSTDMDCAVLRFRAISLGYLDMSWSAVAPPFPRSAIMSGRLGRMRTGERVHAVALDDTEAMGYTDGFVSRHAGFQVCVRRCRRDKNGHVVSSCQPNKVQCKYIYYYQAWRTKLTSHRAVQLFYLL